MKFRLVVLGVVAPGALLFAQLPNASAPAAGLSGAFSARARGYDAVAWNPANLGMPGNPVGSFGLLALSGSSSLDPVTLRDVGPYLNNRFDVGRDEWLRTVTANGGQNGRFDGGITYLGFSGGPIAGQVATSVSGAATLNPDAFEALMFGPTGRPGTTRALDPQNSTFNVGAFTTSALSYGWPVDNDRKAGKISAIGITAKYILGNYLAMAQGDPTAASPNKFPGVYSNPDSNRVVGRGMGFDLGMAWSQGQSDYSVTVENVYNNFSWDTSKLRSRSGGPQTLDPTTGLITGDKPFADAPQALRDRVTSNKFKRAYGAGVSFAASPSVTFSADTRHQAGDGILFGPATQASSGIEYRGLPLLRLRAGASYLTGGWGVSGGAGIALGRYELAIGVARRTIDGVKDPLVTINVLSFR